jgi:hypothetical protein
VEKLSRRLEPLCRKHAAVSLAYLRRTTEGGRGRCRAHVDLAILLEPTRGPASGRPGSAGLDRELEGLLAGETCAVVLLESVTAVACWELVREARLVFARTDDILNRFELHAWRRYQDSRRVRGLADEYLVARALAWFSRKA